MKILIFTPAIQASAIGRVACLTAHSLVSLGHDITIVRSESEEFLDWPTHAFDVPQVCWNDRSQVGALIDSEWDAAIYHVGDNYSYHRGCLEWLPRCRGIVCLHDFFVGNLFQAWAATHVSEARSILQNWYGPSAAEVFYGFSSIEAFIEGTRNTSPLTEWICSMASGVITHSSWGIDRVLKSCPGPVEVVPLAYDRPAAFGEAQASRTVGRFNVLTVGHVNFNKRAESVIKAIGASSILRNQADYRLVGAVQSDVSERLAALALDNGVRLVISGEVNDAELARAISEADVMTCLRWPTLEAASASTIEAMLYGKSTIVTNAGFYSEIPDQYVLKIDPSNEVAEIRSALEHLLCDQDFRVSLGVSAKDWAERTFSAANYAERIIEMATKASRAEPVIEMVEYFSNVMGNWGGSIKALCPDETLSPLEILK